MGIIAWNIPNMITIVLMAVVGYVILALLAQLYQYEWGSKTSTATGTSSNTSLNWAGVKAAL